MLGWLPLVLACSGPEPGAPNDSVPPQVDEPEIADPVRALRRASMALRGTWPPPEDVEAVRADPSRLHDIVYGYTASPQFGESMRVMHDENLHLSWDVVFHMPPRGPLDPYTDLEITVAQDSEALRYIEHVVLNDRPYTEIVTGQTTMSDEILAHAYGFSEFDFDGPEWQEVHYEDGRPMAGILSSNQFVQRYQSTTSNKYRGRAQAVAAGLLCDDIAAKPGLGVSVWDASADGGVSAGQGGELPDATQENPDCVVCHVTLDPLAAAWQGSRGYVSVPQIRQAYADGCPTDSSFACYPLQLWGEDNSGWGLVEPALYGQPVEDLADLGRAIAEDPRFATCAAERFYSWFTQTPRTEVPFEIESRLAEAFVASGFDARRLATDVVLSPEFDQVQVIRPTWYARFVTDVTGYEFLGTDGVSGVLDIARNNRFGLHTVMGGSDGWYLYDSDIDPAPSKILAYRWLAQEAAAFAVEQDLVAEPADRLLLTAADPADTSDAAVDAQLRHLRQRILAEDDPDVTSLRALYDDILATHPDQPDMAWKAVVAALLSHGSVVMY